MSPVFDADGLAFGYAGITANTLLNAGECAQAAASNADIVVEFSGTNDLTNGEANNTPAGIAASRLAMWHMLIATGKQVVACTILPRRDNTALNASIRTANRLIRKNAMATPGVVPCDWHAALVDPADGHSSTLYLRTDNLRVNAVGAGRMGKLLADVLDKLIPTFGDSDLPTANGEGLINNSLMTGTGGTYFGNNTGFGTASGPVATGWTLGNSGGEGGSITCAKVARKDFWPGEWQQVTLATPPNPTSDRMWLRGTSTAFGGAVIGDLVYAAVEFETDAAG